jgi:hypothetical protein
LWGLHVDLSPGDRANDCQGQLEPIGVIGTGASQKIAYRCRRCQARVNNRPAPDDASEALLELSTNPIHIDPR